MAIHIPTLVDRLPYRYPSYLLDAVVQHEPGRRLVAAKNVTINEEFFQGHFPGAPVMPGVLMIEALTQVATVLLLEREGRGVQVYLRGVDKAKFRRQVVPGDQLQLDVVAGPAPRPAGPCALRRAHRPDRSSPRPICSLEVRRAVDIDPRAIVHPIGRDWRRHA